MNKIIKILVLTFLKASFVFAGTMGEVICNGEVTMPCAVQGWDFTVQALYLKTTNSVDFFQPFASEEVFLRHSPKWGWGFVFGGSFHWGLGRDIKLNWYHYGRTTEREIFFPVPALPDESYLSTEFRVKWDAVNIEFGQTVVFGPLTNMRIHMGSQYTRIGHDIYINNDDVFTAADTLQTSLHAFGGRLGVEITRNLTNCLSLYIENAGSVLVGRNEFHTRTYGNIDIFGRSTLNKVEIVPEFEGKIGGRVKYELAQGDFNLDVGFMANKYFDAQLFKTVSGNTNTVDFGLYGAFLRFNYIGYV